MPNINDIKKSCEEVFENPCGFIDDLCILKHVEPELDYPDVMFAPLFVDMFVTNYTTLTNTVSTELTKSKNGFYYVVHLKMPMPVGSIIEPKSGIRTYFLAEYKGRDSKGSFLYKIKSVDDVSVNELDRTVLYENVKVFKRGKLS